MTVKCRNCSGEIIARTIDTEDGRFTARLLVCNDCDTIIDKSWWNNEYHREMNDEGPRHEY